MKNLIANSLTIITSSFNFNSNNQKSILDIQKSSFSRVQMIAIKGGSDIIIEDEIGG